MTQQIIRLFKSSNSDFLCNAPSQGAVHMTSVPPLLHQQNAVPSLQFLQRLIPTTVSKPTRIIVNSTHSPYNFSHEVTSKKTNDSFSIISDREKPINSSSCVAISILKANNKEFMPLIATQTSNYEILSSDIGSSPLQMTTPPSNKKRISSPGCESTEQSQSQTAKRRKVCEKNLKIVKRKNWTEQETKTFIEVWSEFYPKLMSGGSRNSPIYHTMADQLNKMFTDRSVGSTDVKAKVGNLVTEYRKRKKDQGRTGASPSTWPYYDLIDKLIGERPYNNDSLSSESIITEEEQEEFLDEIINTPICDSHLTQVSEQVDDNASTKVNNDKSNDTLKENSINLEGSTSVNVDSKFDNSVKISPTTKKTIPTKKKKIFELKFDLIKELVTKMENASEAASRSEIKVLELLEKQTELQEESTKSEREFLNLFKGIMNNMTTNR